MNCILVHLTIANKHKEVDIVNYISLIFLIIILNIINKYI